jgi:hypothetical protein
VSRTVDVRGVIRATIEQLRSSGDTGMVENLFAADAAMEGLIEAACGAERRLLHLCETALRGHECAFARRDWRALHDALARIGDPS